MNARCSVCLSLMLAISLGPLGCGGDDAVDPEPAPAQPAPTPTALKSSERMQGSWTIVLSEAELRHQAIMKLAIQDPPPSTELLQAMEMSPEERTQFKLTVAAIQQGDPEMIAELTTTIENLDKAVLTLTADQLIMDFGGVKDVASYAVSSENSDGVLLKSRREGEPEETLDISFPGPDQLRLVDPSVPQDAMTFQRR